MLSLRADNQALKLFIISIGSSKSRQTMAAVRSSFSGLSTASIKSSLSQSCSDHIFILGRLSSVVTRDYAFSVSIKSFTQRKEESRAAQSLPILSTFRLLLRACTYLPLISRTMLLFPEPQFPSKSKKESYYSSRCTTSCRIDCHRFSGSAPPAFLAAAQNPLN